MVCPASALQASRLVRPLPTASRYSKRDLLVSQPLGASGAAWSCWPLIIDAAEPEPFRYDREHVLLLTDWTFENPASVFRNLKTMEGFYNFQERTLADFFADVRRKGFSDTVEMRQMWAKNAHELARYRRCDW